MSNNSILTKNNKFETERLRVESWHNYASTPNNEVALAHRIISILTPEVTKALPAGWQKINTLEQANEWIKARIDESAVLAIHYLPDNMLVGFLFLNEDYSTETHLVEVRLGYLLSEEAWGKGLGSELIRGLLAWCEKAGNVLSVLGGVEINNKASIRILEKNGFRIVTLENPGEDMIFLERKFKSGKL